MASFNSLPPEILLKILHNSAKTGKYDLFQLVIASRRCYDVYCENRRCLTDTMTRSYCKEFFHLANKLRLATLFSEFARGECLNDCPPYWWKDKGYHRYWAWSDFMKDYELVWMKAKDIREWEAIFESIQDEEKPSPGYDYPDKMLSTAELEHIWVVHKQVEGIMVGLCNRAGLSVTTSMLLKAYAYFLACCTIQFREYIRSLDWKMIYGERHFNEENVLDFITPSCRDSFERLLVECQLEELRNNLKDRNEAIEDEDIAAQYETYRSSLKDWPTCERITTMLKAYFAYDLFLNSTEFGIRDTSNDILMSSLTFHTTLIDLYSYVKERSLTRRHDTLTRLIKWYESEGSDRGSLRCTSFSWRSSWDTRSCICDELYSDCEDSFF